MESLGLSHDQLQALMKLLKDQNNYPIEKMTDENNIVATKALGKQQNYFLLRKLDIRDRSNFRRYCDYYISLLYIYFYLVIFYKV